MVDPDANIIFGMSTDLKLDDEVRITIIATGFPQAEGSMFQDERVSQLLMEALGEKEDLDMPPFLRRHPATRSRARAF